MFFYLFLLHHFLYMRSYISSRNIQNFRESYRKKVRDVQRRSFMVAWLFFICLFIGCLCQHLPHHLYYNFEAASSHLPLLSHSFTLLSHRKPSNSTHFPLTNISISGDISLFLYINRWRFLLQDHRNAQWPVFSTGCSIRVNSFKFFSQVSSDFVLDG